MPISSNIRSGFRPKVAAKRRAERLEAQVKRMENGEATTKDILKYYGGVRMTDVIKGRRMKK